MADSVSNKQIEKKRGRGRPPGAKNKRTIEIEERARKHAGDAIATLVDVANNGAFEGARVSAAVALLDRGFGKPRQAVEHSGKDGQPIVHQFWHFGDRPVKF